ncbi:MAG TPA: pyrimidine dimer DNA glycosylase/endonuclease V [Gemmatimonadota bacterium]|nr:pyrimidine dimer DNA glycosylase/endonuclease V [Gemmatimonadota bacterium]
MRLWSLHPRHLDARGLVALWREGLLAQKVLLGETRGYRHHPQLDRFRRADDPTDAIARYLESVAAEALERGYCFDRSRIRAAGEVRLPVTAGQLAHEWAHLRAKLERRAPADLARTTAEGGPEPHPMFDVVAGGVEAWERPGGPLDGAGRAR